MCRTTSFYRALVGETSCGAAVPHERHGMGRVCNWSRRCSWRWSPPYFATMLRWMSQEGPEVPPSGDTQEPAGDGERAAGAPPGTAPGADPSTSTSGLLSLTGTPDGTTGARQGTGSDAGRSPSGRRGATLSTAPKQIGDFEVVRRLGTGGMAEVFLAKKRGAE